MNYAEIKQYDVANGPGVRVSLFVSGCTHHCKECFNPETWDFGYGKPFTEETIETIIKYLEPSYIKGLTLLGGDPLERCNQIALLPLVKKVKAMYPEKTIWCYTGYDLEKDILGYMVEEWEATAELVSYLDVLVDGEFILEQKNLKLAFRGSSNQRIILVQETLKSGQLCLWHSEYEKETGDKREDKIEERKGSLSAEKKYFFITKEVVRRVKANAI